MPPEPKKAKYPKVADFIYNLPEMGRYMKTNVPGESELVSRLLGVEPKYNYRNIANPVDEFFENPGGPKMYTGGREEGHMNKTIKYHNELARKIIAKYPEVTHFGFN